MSHLSEAQINKFKALYKNAFEIELDNATALAYATDLLGLVKAVYKPVQKPKEKSRPVRLYTQIVDPISYLIPEAFSCFAA